MQESESKSVVTVKTGSSLAAGNLPDCIVQAGPAASFAWEEFFEAKIRNEYTRRAYLYAVRHFLAWASPQQPDLAKITPGMVGRYFDSLAVSIPTKKMRLAGLRAFFDVLVQRHVMLLNPAHSVRVERYVVLEGRTPTITVAQARLLLKSLECQTPVDIRDRAIIAVLVYTAARAGAIAKLRVRDFVDEGTQFVLRFAEKGGKVRSIPVRHDLQEMLQAYLALAAGEGESKDSPLFRSVPHKQNRFSNRPLTGGDICRLVKKRANQAALPQGISPHSFRNCTATDLLSQGVPLEDVQYLLGHSDARTTRLYDRRQKQVTRNIVERISV
jgi:site-specific recombinase XerD